MDRRTCSAMGCGGGRLRARKTGYGVQPHPSFAGASTRASRTPQQKPSVRPSGAKDARGQIDQVRNAHTFLIGPK